MIIAVLIVGNALLIYYMMNLSDYSGKIENLTEEKNVVSNQTEEVDTIANLLNTVVTTNNTTNSTTVEATDASNRKVMNENLIVLYNGLILDTTKMDQVELKYIDNTSVDKDKYEIGRAHV